MEHTSSNAARPTFESWLLRGKRGQILAVYVDGVELARETWEADGDRIHLRTPIAQTAVTAAVRRGGACVVVGAEPAGRALAVVLAGADDAAESRWEAGLEVDQADPGGLE